MKILLTGGAGYIGTHTAIVLLQAGHDVIVVDNFINSTPESIRRVEKITDRSIQVVDADVCDAAALQKVFETTPIDAVIHFAGLKAVGESTEAPLRYYRNNLDSTLTLLEAMQQHGVTKLLFSSTGAVYSPGAALPLVETSPTGEGITNAYSRSKYMIEGIIRDTATSWPALQATVLRYFNPIGAHPSGIIGEDPKGIPNNLMPYIAQTAVGKRDVVHVFGDDYDTPDGTGMRDYIHVMDVARGHMSALDHLRDGLSIYNLGTGKGVSVLELIGAFSKACGHDVPYKIESRRPGDIDKYYAGTSLAQQEMNWKAELTIDDACRDSWHWQSQNPDGYGS